MSVGGLIKSAFKLVTGGVGSLVLGALTKKKKEGPAPVGPATRDEAEEMADREDAMRRRRGSAADLLTGVSGAEGGGGAKFVAGN